MVYNKYKIARNATTGYNGKPLCIAQLRSLHGLRTFKKTYPESIEVLKENIVLTHKSILGSFSDLLKIATLGVSPYKVSVKYKFKSLIS